MARKRKPIQDETTPPPEPITDAPVPRDPDPAATPPAGDPARYADPVGVQSVALTAGNDGPKALLLRSNKFQQMRIQFDEKPGEAVRDRLNAEGWKWRGEEKVWTKQLDRESWWRSHADAERLFQEIANDIRAANGLPPTADLGRA